MDRVVEIFTNSGLWLFAVGLWMLGVVTEKVRSWALRRYDDEDTLFLAARDAYKEALRKRLVDGFNEPVSQALHETQEFVRPASFADFGKHPCDARTLAHFDRHGGPPMVPFGKEVCDGPPDCEICVDASEAITRETEVGC